MKDNFDEEDDLTVYSIQINTAVFFQASKQTCWEMRMRSQE